MQLGNRDEPLGAGLHGVARRSGSDRRIRGTRYHTPPSNHFQLRRRLSTGRAAPPRACDARTVQGPRSAGVPMPGRSARLLLRAPRTDPREHGRDPAGSARVPAGAAGLSESPSLAAGRSSRKLTSSGRGLRCSGGRRCRLAVIVRHGCLNHIGRRDKTRQDHEGATQQSLSVRQQLQDQAMLRGCHSCRDAEAAAQIQHSDELARLKY